MAVTTLKPSVKIQNQFKTIRSGFSSAAKTSVGIGKILFKKTKVKREAIVNDQKLFNRRRENSRRKISEDTLEMSQVGGIARATGTVIENSTGGLLGRIMDAIGSFIVGWLVYNLPNIIRMVENLITRIKTAGQILGNFVKNIGKIFTGSGRLLGAVLTNLVTLDIFDTSNRVESAFTDLQNTFSDLQTGIRDGINSVTTPLGQMPGETAAGFGDDLTSAPEQVGAGERTGTVTTSGGGGGGENPKDLKSGAQLLMRKGFSEKGAAYLAGNIQQESGWNAMRKPWVLNDGAGTNKGLISWNRTRITAAEKFLGKPLETASSSEQIDWIKEEMKQYGVLKTFQDKNASDEQLKKSSYGYIGWGDLGERWKYSEVALQHLKKSGSGSSQLQSTPAQPTPAQTTSAPTPAAINPRKTISKGSKVGDTIKTSGFGMRWGKQHGGIDLGCDVGTYISCKYPCKVVEARYEGGYGYYTDIIIPSLNIRLRFAHLSSQLIKSGDVPAGKPFARSGNSGNSTGPHIHMEATKNMGGTAYGGDFNPDPYVDAMIFSAKPPQGFVAPVVPSTNITPPAQIALPKPGQQVPSTSRRAPQVAIINDIPQQQMQAPQNVGAQPAPMQMPTLDKSKVLNSLIKNHLLLDLAYT
jgi:murein DD-endopeptidase MepM/ murein hydrolase activator NlpD